KNLIILGPNRDLNDANATRGAEAIITAASNASLITIESNVTSYTIDGFNLVGADYSESNNGRMVWAKGGGTVSTIRNNLIDLTSNASGTKRYIWLGGAGSVSSGSTYISGQVSHNRFRAFGTGSGFNGLIMMQWSAAFTISGNKFENLTGQRNILIWHPTATTVVENNEFARVDSNTGDLLWIGGPPPGSAPAGPGIVVRNNKFSNPSSKGVVFFSYGSNVAVTGNDFSGVGGIKIELQSPPASTTINASGNWWGTTDGAVISGSTSVTLAGQSLDYTPFLGLGTDTSPGTVGFQPDLAAVTVTTDKAQVGAIGRVQEGLDLVAAGGTLSLLAGTYTETGATVKVNNLTIDAPAGVTGFG
ncbi:MAG: right-handed parallel beta-helix repeat-containing protein, partial [Acidobacteriota bacterium]